MALANEGFAADTVLLKVMFSEVDELFTHFIVRCDDESAVFAINSMTHEEGLRTTVILFLEVISGTEKITKLHIQ